MFSGMGGFVLSRIFQSKPLLSWMGIFAITFCLVMSGPGYASGEERSTEPTFVAAIASPHPCSIACFGQIPPATGQIEPSGATDTSRQNLYATIAGFLVAGIPVYYIWRRKTRNK
ncbi:MAG: hypothetical protein ABRQ23_11615 [Syntrophomonadaceae bacterium]